MYLVARSTEPADTIAAAMAREIHAIEPSAPIFDVKTMQERVALSTSRQRFSMMLLEAFALFALILAVVGVYGVISYQVEQATRDIGIRTALGAQPSDVLALVLRQGAKLAAIGGALGLAGALIFSRAMESMLFGVSAKDPGTFVLVVLIVVWWLAQQRWCPRSARRGLAPCGRSDTSKRTPDRDARHSRRSDIHR